MDTFDYVSSWLCHRLHIRSERGASLVEYGLLLALIAVVCIAAVTFLGETASDSYERNTNSMFN
jgi:pilus assembly protein Flp/PilA